MVLHSPQSDQKRGVVASVEAALVVVGIHSSGRGNRGSNSPGRSCMELLEAVVEVQGTRNEEAAAEERNEKSMVEEGRWCNNSSEEGHNGNLEAEAGGVPGALVSHGSCPEDGQRGGGECRFGSGSDFPGQEGPRAQPGV